MNKTDLFDRYIRLWQFFGDIRRNSDCIRSAKSHTSHMLDKNQERLAIGYWRSYVRINPIFHAFYTEKTGIFDEKYIPDNLYYTKIDPFYNDWNAAKTVDNKCYYENIFSVVGGEVRHPITLFRRVNNKWIDRDWHIISFEDMYTQIASIDCFFLKLATQSEGGHGVFFFETGKEEFESKFNKTVEEYANDLVIQLPIKQCEQLSAINKSSINTIRILSLFRNGEIKVYSSILRMGIGDSKVDNASSGGITCGIDDSGRLKRVAYSANGDRYDVHPTSKVAFSDVIIPGYQKAMELVKRLHPVIPNFRLVSWDIAIDEHEEPVLVECNLKYGELDFHQLNNGPLFGEDTEEILREVFKS